MKCITIGGATVDIITQVSAEAVERLTMHNTEASFMMLALGRKIETDSIEISVGGGAVNASVSIKRQGHDVLTIIKIKDDINGEKVVDLLNAEAIATDYVIRGAKNPTATSILLSSVERDPTVFTYRGANTELTDSEITQHQFDGVDLAYITALSGDSAKAFPHMTKLAKQSGAFVATNPGILQLQRCGDEILDSLPNIDCLTVNNTEASQLIERIVARKITKSKVDVPNNYKHIDKMRFIRAGLAKNDIHMTTATFMQTMVDFGLQYIVVTDGKNGSYMGTDTGIYFSPALLTNVKGTIGAGDAFASTLSSYLAGGKNEKQALIAAAINSASVVSYTDTQTGLLSKDNLAQQITDNLLNDVLFMEYK